MQAIEYGADEIIWGLTFVFNGEEGKKNEIYSPSIGTYDSITTQRLDLSQFKSINRFWFGINHQHMQSKFDRGEHKMVGYSL